MNAFEQIQMESLIAAQEAIFFSTEKSRAKKIENFAAIDKAIRLNIEMIEKWLDYTLDYLKFIPTAANTEDAQKERGVEYANKSMEFDYGRGTTKELIAMSRAYTRNRRRILDRADMKKEDVQEAEKALLLKLLKDGEYTKRLDAMLPKFKSIKEQVEAGWKKYDGQTYILRGYNTVAQQYNWYVQQWGYTKGDTAHVVKVSTKHGFDPTKYEKHDDAAGE